MARHLSKNDPQCNNGLVELLAILERHYGEQRPFWPTDPYLFLLWWNSGYPASDAECSKGWEAVNREFSSDPEMLLEADNRRLAAALKAGGIIPEVRAERIKELASRVVEEFGGDLAGALKKVREPQRRRILKSFPGISDPGADRILLFAGISATAAVPSSSPQVLLRMIVGSAGDNYSRNYRQAQTIIGDQIAPEYGPRQRAFLLLKRHGDQICKRSAPRCNVCPLAQPCAFTHGLRGR
jgi:endonuclease-3